ncbi:hypothetical protein ACQ4M3_09400 [Leptolyngbya sp. AN03gr2]|uniref:hypothetical protein n=1 Tax=Leptolyngbya sp. AN03gr2 TaxID=3423364 RepID=UPI003D310566
MKNELSVGSPSGLPFSYVQTLDDYERAIKQLGENRARLATDSETRNKPGFKQESARLNPHQGEIALLTLQSDQSSPTVFDLVCLESEAFNPRPLVELMQRAEYLIAHNAKFDFGMILGYFGVLMQNCRCTLQLARLLSNATGSKFGLMRGHTLADLCRDFLNVRMTGKGSLQRADWGIDSSRRRLDNPQWVEMLTYAANDTPHLFSLHDFLIESLCNPLPPTPLIQTTRAENPGLGMSAVVEIEMALIPVIVEIEFNGLPVSRSVMNLFQRAITKRKESLAVELCEEFRSQGLKNDPMGLWGDLVANPASVKTLNNPTKMKQILSERLGADLTSTQTKTLERALDILKGFSNDEEDIELINEQEEATYRDLEQLEDALLLQNADLVYQFLQYKKMLKTESMDLRPYINSVSGRIHSKYDANRAATGRSNSSGPNAQQISGRTEVVVELEVDMTGDGAVIFPSDSKEVLNDWLSNVIDN